MAFIDAAPPSRPLTPCIGACRLDARGFCVGCRRSGAEIAAWRDLADAERRHFIDVVLPARVHP